MAVTVTGEGFVPSTDREQPKGITITGDGFMSAGKAATKAMVKSAVDFANQRDPEIDYYNGVDASTRADFSRMDTEEERVMMLNKLVGEGNFRKDSFGAWVIDPPGLERIGIHSDMPRALDEQGMSLRDLADMRGEAPVIAGAAVASLLTGGLGVFGAAGLAGAFAMMSKLIDERLDQAAGENLQPQAEVAQDAMGEAALATTGEGVYRGILGPAGRKLMAPERGRMTERSRELARQAEEIGARPTSTQLTRAPILGRTEAMIDKIFRFGDKMDQLNLGAIQAERARMIQNVLPQGRSSTRTRVIEGEDVVASIRGARTKLSQDASRKYAEVDAITGGADIVPTARLKTRATEMVDALPVDDQGEVILTDPQTIKTLQEISRLPDQVSTVRMQAIRDKLRQGIDLGTLTPDMASREARLLTEAASETFNDAALYVGPEAKAAVEALRKANTFYAKEIQKFDDAFINKLTKSPNMGGAVDPEAVTGMIFRPGKQSRVAKVKKVVDDETWKNIQGAAMEDITESLFARSPDPTIGQVLSSDNMLKTLDKFGRETLNEMFGKSHTDALYRLGEVTQLVTQKQALSGGLVAAHIALHPLQNVGKLVQLNVIGRFLHSKSGVKWLTEGLDAPKTRAGSAALARATTYMATLTDEFNVFRENETGVARITLQDPEPPE